MGQKIYIHKDIVVSILFTLLINVIFGYYLIKSINSILLWIVYILSFLLLLSTIVNLWNYRHKKYSKLKLRHSITIEINDFEIDFTDGYYFIESTINIKNKVQAEQINEVCIETLPPSFIINDNEVIFINYGQNKLLYEFALRNNIKVSKRLDIWEYLNTPYLDTEFEKTEKEKILVELEQNGISKSEVKKIRLKILPTMIMNFFAWDWQYLGQYDYLQWTALNDNKYWWSMEIALRNYKK